VSHKQLARLRFPARAEELSAVRRTIRVATSPLGVSSQVVDELVLAVNEACMNIIQHAYGEHQCCDIVLDVVQCADELIFRLTDFASPIDKTTVRPRDLSEIRPGGLGLHIITQVMDTAHFQEPPVGAGNLLEMRRRIPRRPIVSDTAGEPPATRSSARLE
jgi:sigma-B regulation protein RsbU (phosphoserine phosphatase)